ncbi:class I SAM-dependent methyltransferase [Telmatobacter sp. DSM 110680]|uniref:Class I SAM-dependent methyltransferase n=1 Tax=Telmatobacter sp. DSM 110680 TaxID=3036704 RepID=A0AAU7DEK6_9BACT
MSEKLAVIFSDRRALKLFLKTIGKAILDQYQAVKVAFLRSIGVIDFPVPPNSRMRGTSSNTIRHYYESGLTTTLPIITAAYIEGLDLRATAEVLDFGCGVGRQLLHLERNFPGLTIHACDVNDRSIEFVRNAYPRVESYTSAFSPPLKYPDRKFDLIYSVSIFSHLNIRDHALWLHELGRVTRPGGLCCLTILGTHARTLRSKPSPGNAPGYVPPEVKALQEQGYLYESNFGGKPKPEYMKAVERIWSVGSNLIGIDEDYGRTYYSEKYVRDNWNNESFEFRQYIPGIIDTLQDLVVLKKR